MEVDSDDLKRRNEEFRFMERLFRISFVVALALLVWGSIQWQRALDAEGQLSQLRRCASLNACGCE